MSEHDTSGWNAFDEPTRAWLRARLAQPGVDVHGDKIILEQRRDRVREALRVRPQRASQLARSLGLMSLEAKAAADALVAAGVASQDAEGFYALEAGA